NLYHPEVEEKSIDLYFKYGVTHVEAAAFMTITPALIRFRVKGLKRLPDGTIARPHKVIAKLSRPEVAVQYLSPPPEKVIQRLLTEGKITQEEAELSKFIPMAEDITVEADSGGHTDKGIAYALMPAFMRFRDEAMAKHKYPVRIRIGAAGGLGTPQSIAAAFVLGADYVLTGSINQCTVEAGTSDIAKDLLAGASMADTEMAPAGDMFELGVQVQVLRKGTFFPQRAQKLYELWKRHNSLEDIEPKERENLEKKVFKKTFNEIYESVKEFFGRVDPAQVVKAEANPKHKMALVFRWYLGLSSRWGIKGEAEHKVDFQIHTGPAQGAFNEWVKGTRLEDWRNRHVDEIADLLMQGAAKILTGRLMAFTGRPIPGFDFNLTPR
ncbi:MAG: PfaD family polyunsaturated fatty acid/polyketide biosynthesis protein, partial [Spirochaetia bacterium]|nr:PfaD family polyunsaturated fatty acid/polyketide biosynthesis protein [Spirochaetia bacterium]